jgi:hypothetical protein
MLSRERRTFFCGASQSLGSSRYPIARVTTDFRPFSLRPRISSNCEGSKPSIGVVSTPSSAAAGVEVDEGDDWWIVKGCGFGNVEGGVTVESRLDHRIAMSFMVMGMATNKPMSVDDGSPIATSFPIFEPLMADLGAAIERSNV